MNEFQGPIKDDGEAGGVQREKDIVDTPLKLVREVTLGRERHDDKEPVKESFGESSVMREPACCVRLWCRGA